MSRQGDRQPLPPWFPIAFAIFIIVGGALNAWKEMASPSWSALFMVGVPVAAVAIGVIIYVFYWIHRYRVEVRPLSPFERRVRFVAISCIIGQFGIATGIILLTT